MTPKPQHRERCLTLLRGMTAAQRAAKSQAIRERVLHLPELIDASSVFVYAAGPDEVQTQSLISDLLRLGKRVAVPRVEDRATASMSAVLIRSLDELTPGSFGLLTPPDNNPVEPAPGLALIPGLAFDPAVGTRLGRGGGYYDRWLADHPDTTRVGLAFDTQLLADLPADAHDQPMQVVVTESSLLRFA